MEPGTPPPAAMEEATAGLLHLAFLEIRLLTAVSGEGESADVVARRREQAHEIADICHNLPLWLDPSRRAGLADGLRHLWRTAGVRQRRWLRSRWDHLGYDHRWLTDVPPEAPPLPARTGP